MPEIKVADMVHDYRALETARKDAADLVQADAFWTDPEYKELRQTLIDSGVLGGDKLS